MAAALFARAWGGAQQAVEAINAEKSGHRRQKGDQDETSWAKGSHLPLQLFSTRPGVLQIGAVPN